MSIISRATLSSWLESILQTQTLVAPKDVSGVLLYRSVSDISEIVWDYILPVMSVKEAFFPATERLLTIEKTGQTVELRETLPENEQIIFGVRPCDARALLAMDALFLDTAPVDPYYALRREQTTLIGLACTEIAETCFCTRTGGAPDDPSGMDVMVYPVGEGYQVQVFTEKGARMVEGLG
ncbi:MAG TPA: sulfite reductase, partial [Chloroflexi bacterium]|nr:sulfite reductase [Chloroflexota bacterium]